MRSNAPILLIEDDDVDILSIQRAFRELNIRNPLVIRTNGEEALEYLQSLTEGHPGLIILDLNMPKINGLEFLKMYKSIDELKWIPAVVLTTSTNQHDVKGAYALQAAGYVVKPLNFDEFKDAICTLFNYWWRCELPEMD